MAVLAQLNAAITAGAVNINLAALSEFDSSALSVLLAARRAQPRGGSVQCLNVPDKLRRLANLYGVESLIFDES